MSGEKTNHSYIQGEIERLAPQGEPWKIFLAIPGKKDEKLFTRQLRYLGIELELRSIRDGIKGLPETYDLVVLDESIITEKNLSRLREVKEAQKPSFSPILSLVSAAKKDRLVVKYGNLIDEMLIKPLRKDELNMRVKSLLSQRQISLQLETRYRSITRNVQELISIIDGNGNYLYANRAHERFLGCKPSELVGEKIIDLVHPEDSEKFRSWLTSLAAKTSEGELAVGEGEKLESRVRVQSDSREDRWIEATMTPLERMDGENRFLLTARDVTDQKHAEDELRQERDRAQKYLEMAGTIILILDREGTVTEVNKRGSEVLGYPKEEIIGENWFKSFLPERTRQKTYEESFKLLLQDDLEGSQYENPVLTKEGEERTISWRSTRIEDDDGQVKRILSSGRDVTELLELERTRKLFGSSLDQASLEVFWLNPEGKFVYSNKRVKERLGYSKEELEDMHVWDIDPGTEKDSREDHWTKLKDRGVLIFESLHRSRSGATFPVEIISHYMEYEGEEFEFAFAKDITRRKKSQNRIEYLNELYRSISKINELIVREDDFGKIIEKARKILLERDSYIRVEIMGFGFSEEEDVYAGEGNNLTINVTPEGTGDGPNCLKKALKEEKPIIWKDSNGDSCDMCPHCGYKHHATLDEHQTIAIPLIAEGMKHGAMIITLAPDTTLQDKELDLLSEVSSDLAYAREKLQTEKELEKTTIGTLEALSRTVEAKDEYTGDHIDRVQEHALALGEELGLSSERLEQLRYASELHDVGKVRIPDSILTKNGKLTEEEWKEMERHPGAGEEIVGAVPRLKEAAKIVGQHQEKFDGTGYPKGLEGEEITLGARIIAVVDAWDAMRTDRPYRDALPREEAVSELKENAGSQFDPEIVDRFLEFID